LLHILDIGIHIQNILHILIIGMFLRNIILEKSACVRHATSNVNVLVHFTSYIPTF